ncbi:hypothetical protein CEE69_02135 [Rhodopirellula bahusiensis]|uniref:Uncharacterized protein n=1 Tax=Rhodopirellula bahusiensis TaxID=2014065 RepID=A0A2G1WDN9_9BACT|nr:hypothetical protein CEE69_02135 [Rhodopirellula bahusiensis]
MNRERTKPSFDRTGDSRSLDLRHTRQSHVDFGRGGFFRAQFKSCRIQISVAQQTTPIAPITKIKRTRSICPSAVSSGE